MYSISLVLCHPKSVDAMGRNFHFKGDGMLKVYNIWRQFRMKWQKGKKVKWNIAL